MRSSGTGPEKVIGGKGGILARLRRDRRGNTLAIMAAALIPMAGFAGTAVDMARLYVVKVRLQQACDAGVLVGRKLMAASDATTIDAAAAAQAQTFFRNNFRPGWMGTTDVRFVPVKTADKQVAGTAYATVPMTLMKFFASPEVPLSLPCEARFDVADTDIMFVLDTTGSMACLDSDKESDCNSYVVQNTAQRSDGGWSTTEKTNSRISKVRTAVENFYDQLTSQVDPSTHLRFGFVPYSTTVNVGRLLDRSWISTSKAQYQTRTQLPDVTSGKATSTTTSTKAADCKSTRSPATGYKADYSYTVGTASHSGGNCTVSSQKWIASFRYISAEWDVADFAAFKTVTTPTIPLMGETSQPTSSWNGCIEERLTTASTSFNTTNPPLDLDPNLDPNKAYDPEAARWRPQWPQVEYSRTQQVSEDSSSNARTPATRYQYGNGTTGYELGYTYNQIACPPAARRLATMTKTEVTDYLKASAGFRPHGSTYHDIGMIWGARLLSPNGLFAADTAAWPGHNAPNRYIIFLTDGDMQPDLYAYSAYGMEQFDRRVTGASPATQEDRHNTRFTTACSIASDRLNIRIFVISYAQSLTTQLTQCGKAPGKAFPATDTTTLNSAFTEIAQQIAMLRVSQ